jgi:glutathione S-transferase
MLKIYGAAHSRAFRVIWLAEESGLPYEHVPVTFGGESPQCKEAWYLALNPNGRVPTIDDDGFIMWESAAINLYLAEKYESPVFPVTSEGKGRLLQWAFFIANDIEPPLITILRNRVVFPPEQRTPKLADEAEKVVRSKFIILEQQLLKTPYFGGDRWDMADFMVACVLYILTRLDLDMSAYPRLDAWLKTSLERPAARRARKLREKI